MKNIWPLVILLGLAVPSSVPAAPSDDAKSYCTTKWESYRMQLYCVEQEEQSRQRLSQRGAIEPAIWARCVQQWDSWRMVDYCVSQEEEAKRRLTR